MERVENTQDYPRKRSSINMDNTL